MKTSRGLGRGLSALFSDTEEAYENASMKDENENLTDTDKKCVSEIAINKIVANPNQPRKVFDESALQDLCNSIKKHGVITPIVVNAEKNGEFMIIAGERRFRASKMAGLTTIPAVVKNYSEREVKEVSLIENLQREDLNPIEAAVAMKQLMDDYSLTQEDLAERIGKSRPAVANTLRLLSLCPEVSEMIADGKLSAGHARALITLSTADQIKMAKEIIKEGISVREVEKRVRELTVPPEILQGKKDKKQMQVSLELKGLVERMRNSFKTKVSLIGSDKKGRIYIDYYTKDDLERLNDILECIEKEYKD